jgi:ferredoxin
LNDPTFWLLARATGVTAYVLLTLAVLAGLVLKSRPFGRALRAATVADTHGFLSSLALSAVVLHGLALVLDSTVKIGLGGVLVPGLSPYRPVAVGLGVAAAELTTLVALSFPLRKRIGQRAWRRLHWATYGIFAAATVHGLAAGSDTVWLFPLYLGAVFAVVFAASWRALTRPNASREVFMYRIVIDRTLCSGFGACVELAPHLIELDDGGTARARTGETDDAAALEAAAACPMAAIVVQKLEEAA